MKLGTDRPRHSDHEGSHVAAARNAAGEGGKYGTLWAGTERHMTARQRRDGRFVPVYGRSSERPARVSRTGRRTWFRARRVEPLGHEDR